MGLRIGEGVAYWYDGRAFSSIGEIVNYVHRERIKVELRTRFPNFSDKNLDPLISFVVENIEDLHMDLKRLREEVEEAIGNVG